MGAVIPTGWAVITLVVVGLELAVAFQWVEALACALAGVVALLLAAMRVAWRPPHVVSIRLPNEHIVAGQTAVGEISVRNECARSVRSGIIELPIGTGTGEFVVPPLGAHETWDEMVLVSSRHRGLINVGPARAVRAEALYGFLPTGKTLQVMVLGSFRAWKDLLTLTAPVSVYYGPAPADIAYTYEVTGPAGTSRGRVETTTAMVDGASGENCMEITTVSRSSGRMSEPLRASVDVP